MVYVLVVKKFNLKFEESLKTSRKYEVLFIHPPVLRKEFIALIYEEYFVENKDLWNEN